MRKFKILFLLFISILAPMNAQEAFFTNISDKQIKTLQVKVEGELFADPFIPLDGERRVEINFDAFNPGFGRYVYNLIHCDADWTRSSLSQIEYMDGFQGSTIDDFANSIGTTTQYTNYRLFFPNDDVRPKVSGNYALQVYNEDDPSRVVFTACFSIYEPRVSVATTVSGNTDIDTNQSHQQVSFTINHRHFPIAYPQSDLKIWVYQNNRRDNAVTGLQPISILENQIVYANNRNLIFPAGNEYRRMEFISDKYNGMHVENISFHNPYYHVELMADQPRSQIRYQYDQDQDGGLLIRCSNCDDADTEADYYIVHFTLAADWIPNGNVYLSGDIYNNVLDEKSRMGYNPDKGRYEKSVLLKQGNYNYQYLFIPEGQTVGQTAPIEGDFFETENKYSVYVYYRPMGARYDRLIGVSTIRNTMPLL